MATNEEITWEEPEWDEIQYSLLQVAAKSIGERANGSRRLLIGTLKEALASGAITWVDDRFVTRKRKETESVSQQARKKQRQDRDEDLLAKARERSNLMAACAELGISVEGKSTGAMRRDLQKATEESGGDESGGDEKNKKELTSVEEMLASFRNEIVQLVGAKASNQKGIGSNPAVTNILQKSTTAIETSPDDPTDQLKELMAAQARAKAKMESDAVARKMTTLTNRRQFEFNAEQLARVAELKPLLDSLSGKGLESAQALMLEIQTKFEKKQQLICIADAEGWLVANHFAGTDIVVTTEDKLKLKLVLKQLFH